MTRTTLLALGLTALALPAAAQEMMFMADLQPAEGVESEGSGMASVTVDPTAMTISWEMTAEGLTGEAGAAHFHGPATPEETAPPVIDMTIDGTDETEEPVAQDILSGSADLTEEQMTQLQEGLLYINVHTEQYPDGEIRGQVVEGEAMMDAAGEAEGEVAVEGEAEGGTAPEGEGAAEAEADSE